MTTENVAILFTDIVGSTELSQRVSAEVADELRRAHFAILREAIAETDGVEVKNLGDGLMAVFNSASAALACSVAMQQGVERGNHDGAESMGLRVGISVGEASKEDDDYFGDPVIEAARLCARCDSGQILATDFVRAMAGRRGRHECRSIGELTLKGLPDPIETVEVVWEPLAGADDIAVPLPGRIASTVSMTFVGRGTERDVLGGSLKAVADGAQQTVLISGEPGIGKTSLSSGFARDAFEDGAIVLYGRCDEDLGIPYQPWSEAISHLVTHLPETLLADHVAARGGELARLVPDLADRVPCHRRRRVTEHRSATCCSGPLSTYSPECPPRHRWCSCWTICTGPTVRRSNSSVTWCRLTYRSGCSCSGRSASPTSARTIHWPRPWRPCTGCRRSCAWHCEGSATTSSWPYSRPPRGTR